VAGTYDTTDTLGVNLTVSQGVLDSVSAQQAAAYASLCYLGGEMLAYTISTQTGASDYSLTELWRGLYGSSYAAHPIGTPFARLDGQIIKVKYPVNLLGTTMFVKFQSFNQFGQQPQPLSACTAYQVTLNPAVAKPDTPTNFSMVGWGSSLNLQCDAMPRAAGYTWSIYKADGVTLIAAYHTVGPAFAYTAVQAALDGIQRSYVATVMATNSAGASGVATSAVLNKPAPPALVTGGSTVTGGGGQANIAFTAQPGVLGYIAFYSATSGFSPMTTGQVATSAISPLAIYAAIGTWYYVVAAYDAWTANPAFLNLSAQQSFVLTATGVAPTGGATGSSGGGYQGGGGGGRGGGQIP
jgi:hypothetical protein